MSRRTLAILAALVLAIGAAFFVGTASASSSMPTYLSDGLAECQAQRAVAVSSADQTWADRCVRLAQRAIDAWNAANPQPTASPTATPTVVPTTVPPTTTPPATTPPATTTPPSPTPSPTSSGFPDATNTGVPPFAVLTAYTGPCTITAVNTVIDAKTVTCDLNIQTTGVVITRSRTQAISDGSGFNAGASFTVTDSEVFCATDTTCVGESNFTLLRVNVHGGNRDAHCYAHCSATDSWFHGIRFTGTGHASAFRLGQYTTLTHDTLSCDAPNTSVGGGCSADVTGYPDFEPINHNTMTLCFLTDPGLGGAYYHAYGGATSGKA
jgi:hypothetical protein